MPRPRNVLFITTDQMRRDHMGCSGNPVIRTPGMDRIAAQGTYLARAYVNNPVCMPNRSTMATGRLPRNHGVWDNGIDLPDCERTIGDILGEAGYRTALLGKPHFRITAMPTDGKPAGIECGPAWEAGLHDPNWSGPYYGFQYVQLTIGHGYANLNRAHLYEWVKRNYPQALAHQFDWAKSPTGAPECFTPRYPAEAHSSNWLGLRGEQYLRERAADPGAPGFLLWVSFPDPHHPFCPPPPYDTMYAPADVPPPRYGEDALADKPPHYKSKGLTEAQTREMIARTYGMIQMVDENVARLLGVLDDTGLADDTIVIYTSDHGDLMGDMGLTHKGPWLLEGLINVPMLWRVPGSPRGARTDGLFNSADIAPTILALLGVDVPAAMDGLAQPELVRGGAGRRDAAFVEYHMVKDMCGGPRMNLRTIITPGRKLTYYAGKPFGELYDMTAGSPEQRNLYDDPAHAGERAALEKRLLDEQILREDERRKPTAGA